MSDVCQHPPEGIPVSLERLQRMAIDAHTVFGAMWDELLLEPQLADQLLAEARIEAGMRLGGWICSVTAIETYVAGEDPYDIDMIDDLGSKFFGRLHGVEIHPIEPQTSLPIYGDACAAMSLVFTPDVLPMFEEGVACMYDRVAVPLLPRFSTTNVDVVKVWRQSDY